MHLSDICCIFDFGKHPYLSVKPDCFLDCLVEAVGFVYVSLSHLFVAVFDEIPSSSEMYAFLGFASLSVSHSS